MRRGGWSRGEGEEGGSGRSNRGEKEWGPERMRGVKMEKSVREDGRYGRERGRMMERESGQKREREGGESQKEVQNGGKYKNNEELRVHNVHIIRCS